MSPLCMVRFLTSLVQIALFFFYLFLAFTTIHHLHLQKRAMQGLKLNFIENMYSVEFEIKVMTESRESWADLKNDDT